MNKGTVTGADDTLLTYETIRHLQFGESEYPLGRGDGEMHVGLRGGGW